jgi:flagellar motor protein MotB
VSAKQRGICRIYSAFEKRSGGHSMTEYLFYFIIVKEDVINISYFGDSVPADNGETLESYAKNRRVEIIIK